MPLAILLMQFAGLLRTGVLDPGTARRGYLSIGEVLDAVALRRDEDFIFNNAPPETVVQVQPGFIGLLECHSIGTLIDIVGD